MHAREILLVTETPSLGRSVSDLLTALGFAHRCVTDVSVAGPLWELGARYSLVLVASNSSYCDTAHRLERGEVSGARVLVIGSRDPVLSRHPAIEVVPLPLEPGRLVAAIERVRNGVTTEAFDLPPMVD